jgi:hypothetical protein
MLLYCLSLLQRTHHPVILEKAFLKTIVRNHGSFTSYDLKVTYLIRKHIIPELKDSSSYPGR